MALCCAPLLADKAAPPVVDEFGKPVSVVTVTPADKPVIVPFKLMMGVPYIESITINGKKVGPVLIDTGSAVSVVHAGRVRPL